MKSNRTTGTPSSKSTSTSRRRIRPADELARAGWRLVYTAKSNAFITAANADDHSIEGWYSYGAELSGEGVVRDVREGSPAWHAGLAPGMHVLAVNNQAFSAGVLEYAIKRAEHSTTPISLITSQNGWFQMLSLDYHGGIRYPHLERIEGTPDMLGSIVGSPCDEIALQSRSPYR